MRGFGGRVFFFDATTARAGAGAGLEKASFSFLGATPHRSVPDPRAPIRPAPPHSPAPTTPQQLAGGGVRCGGGGVGGVGRGGGHRERRARPSLGGGKKKRGPRPHLRAHTLVSGRPARPRPRLTTCSPSAGWAASRASSRTAHRARVRVRILGERKGGGEGRAGGRWPQELSVEGGSLGHFFFFSFYFVPQQTRARVGTSAWVSQPCHSLHSQSPTDPLAPGSPPPFFPSLFFVCACPVSFLDKPPQVGHGRRQRVGRRGPALARPPPDERVLYAAGLVECVCEKRTCEGGAGRACRRERPCSPPCPPPHSPTQKNSPAAPPGARRPPSPAPAAPSAGPACCRTPRLSGSGRPP